MNNWGMLSSSHRQFESLIFVEVPTVVQPMINFDTLSLRDGTLILLLSPTRFPFYLIHPYPRILLYHFVWCRFITPKFSNPPPPRNWVRSDKHPPPPSLPGAILLGNRKRP